VLREVPFGEFVDALPAIRNRVKNDRAILRAFHYLAENDRVDAMVASLLQGQIDRYLALVAKSGQSSFNFLQNLYSPSIAHEQGLPLALAITEQFLEGSGACRVHGGGFAGTIQTYVPTDRSDAYTACMERVFTAGSVTKLAVRSRPTSRLD
jgi:galactokinase